QVEFLADGVTWNPILPPKEVVFGVIDGWVTGQECRTFAGCDAIAYPLSALEELGVAAAVNDSVGERAVLVTYQAEYEVANAFDRTVDGIALTFEIATTSPLVLRDQETGTTWDEQGVAIEGALAGRRLTPIADSYVGFWFAWSLYFKNLRLYQ
ncbi:MAG: DUF3179 domain-containing protein, partial [Gemmatimonadetes bacterium]|nr:DUF3179 domain-containing protein [Gemmatimonadota bacterium]